MGNSYVIYEGDKILVVDKLPKEEAKNCMIINAGGIGFSTTGIHGTFNSAWTIDGTLDMQYVNVLNLTASLINGGTLKLGRVNNSAGVLELYNQNNRLVSRLTKDGLEFLNLLGYTVIKLNEVGLYSYDWTGEMLSLIDNDGQKFYKDGAFIGFIGTNASALNHSVRGLVFGLENNDNAKYMCWGAKESGSSSNYTSVLAYSRANGLHTNEGLHADADFYLNRKVALSSGYAFECYRDLDMEGYSINNCTINGRHAITDKPGYHTVGFIAFAYNSNSSSTNYGYLEVGTVNYGAVGVNVWQSDGRLKRNIKETDTRAIDIINQIQHRQFDWKKSGVHEEIGYIAQELEEIKENFVMKIPQTDENGNVIDEIYQINPEKIIPYLSKSIQELSEENAELRSKLDEQQKQIDFLMKKFSLEEEYSMSNTIIAMSKKKRKKKIKQYDDEEIKIVKHDKELKKVVKTEKVLMQEDLVFRNIEEEVM